MAGVINRLLQFDVNLLSAGDLGDGIGRLAPIRVRTAARPGLLWITTIVFGDPGCGLEQLEMSECTLCDRCHEHNGQYQSNRVFHMSVSSDGYFVHRFALLPGSRLRPAPRLSRNTWWQCKHVSAMRLLTSLTVS